MGLKFGNLKKLSGITFFRLSPYEQRAFAGVGEATGRMIKRLRSTILTAGPCKNFINYLIKYITYYRFTRLQLCIKYYN